MTQIRRGVISVPPLRAGTILLSVTTRMDSFDGKYIDAEGSCTHQSLRRNARASSSQRPLDRARFEL